jgi:hypothetical protein
LPPPHYPLSLHSVSAENSLVEPHLRFTDSTPFDALTEPPHTPLSRLGSSSDGQNLDVITAQSHDLVTTEEPDQEKRRSAKTNLQARLGFASGSFTSNPCNFRFQFLLKVQRPQ